MQQVADVLASHPEIARVAVDGHTDNRGTEASNLDLSRSRAVSVMKWLVDKGVDPRRLEARGFGPRRPIADNKTAEGRAKNRRVEFQIRKKTDKGAAGWVDGPIE
ncbi:MAG: OmpA family protein [Polyangiaceae bacterium]